MDSGVGGVMFDIGAGSFELFFFCSSKEGLWKGVNFDTWKTS
jgi:hypothetical protein